MNRSKSDWFIVYVSGQKGIGWHSLQCVIHHLLAFEHWDMALLMECGLKSNIATLLLNAQEQFNDEAIRQMLEDEHRFGFRSILWNENDYPAILKECAQPPWVIYAKGNIELLHQPAISIVGTRAPTSYGMTMAKKFAKELSERGFTIVSGLAGGIDTLSHQASINEYGSTIAVLPSGIKHCYPASNIRLYEQIAQKGLLLSESVHYAPVHKGRFHERNRIIAALGYATIIIEGEQNSGSMITARHTIEMDRELFAVPGPINCAKSSGPNFLILKGYARMLMTSNQILEELPWLSDMLKSSKQPIATDSLKDKKMNESMSKEENQVLQLLKGKQYTVDELLVLTNIPFGQLNTILLNLCMRQFIKQQPGSSYIAL